MSRGGQTQSRTIQNEAELLHAIRASILALTGQETCTNLPTSRLGRRKAAPCLQLHKEEPSVSSSLLGFKEQVRLFAGAALLLGVTGAALTNMLFMPPDSVVLVLQTVGSRDCYTSMAHACGHYGIPFFVECRLHPLIDPSLFKASARLCQDDSVCLKTLNDHCTVEVDIPRFLPAFAAAFSYAFHWQLVQSEFVTARAVDMD